MKLEVEIDPDGFICLSRTFGWQGNRRYAERLPLDPAVAERLRGALSRLELA